MQPHILKGRRFTYHHCRPCPICYSHTNNHATKRHIKLIKKTTIAILYLILSQYTSKLQTKGITNHLFAVRPKQKKEGGLCHGCFGHCEECLHQHVHHLLIFWNAHSMLWHLLSISFDSKISDWIHQMLYLIWSFKEIKPNTNSIQYMEWARSLNLSASNNVIITPNNASFSPKSFHAVRYCYILTL